jgi:archaellum component FlaG (FlaF/FlaG flagellin family)
VRLECYGHDVLDWFAAVGPTIAAAAAAWAAWSAVKVSKQIHKESQSLQRMIARPLLVVSSRVRHHGSAFNWIVQIANVGQSAF